MIIVKILIGNIAPAGNAHLPVNNKRFVMHALVGALKVGRKLFYLRKNILTQINTGIIDFNIDVLVRIKRQNFMDTCVHHHIVNEQPQPLKVPHLRNLYQKVGMFGMAQVPNIFAKDNGFKGDQVRGFGFTNDGSEDTIFRFMNSRGFDNITALPNSPPVSPNGFDETQGGDGDIVRRQVEQFLLVFDSNLAPIVGQQVTVTSTNQTAANARLDLMVARANVGECDLVGKTRFGIEELGFLYVGANEFIGSSEAFGTIPKSALLAAAQFFHRELTFTCVPPGSGERIGIDRDEDGVRDGDE